MLLIDGTLVTKTVFAGLALEEIDRFLSANNALVLLQLLRIDDMADWFED